MAGVKVYVVASCPYRGGWLVQVAMMAGLGIAHQRADADVVWFAYNKRVGPVMRRFINAWTLEDCTMKIGSWQHWQAFAAQTAQERGAEVPPWPG